MMVKRTEVYSGDNCSEKYQKNSSEHLFRSFLNKDQKNSSEILQK
jgi:hypothetical protein